MLSDNKTKTMMLLMARLQNDLFKNRTTCQTILKNTLWFMMSQGVSRLMRAGIVIYAARILGAEQWGIFSFLLSLASIFVFFSDAGINGLVTQQVSRQNDRPDSSINTAITLRLVLSGIFGIAFVVLSLFSHSIPSAPVLFALIAAITFFDMLRDLGICIARGTERFQVEAAVQIFSNFFTAVLGLLFLLYAPSIFSFTSAYAIASAAGFFLCVYLLRHYISHYSFSLKWNSAKRIVLMALPFSIPAIMGTVMGNTDTVLIRYFGSLEDVGLYSAAQRLIQIVYVAPGLLAVPLFPLMSRLAKSDKRRLGRILEKAISFAAILAFPLFVYLLLYSHDIIRLVYGDEYGVSAVSLQILSATVLCMFPFLILSNAIFSLEMRWTIFSYSLIGVICNGILDILLIPSIGIAGAAFSTTLTTAVIFFYSFMRMRKMLHLSLRSIFNFTVVPGTVVLVLAVFCYYSRMQFIAAGFLIASIYGIVLVGMRHPLLKELLFAVRNKSV